MGHDGVTSGYPKPTGCHRLTVCQQDPRDRGVTKSLSNKAMAQRLVNRHEFHC